MQRIKEFTESAPVYLTQGLVSISTAKTSETAQVAELYKKNEEYLQPWRTAARKNVLAKVFNIYWLETILAGQIILEIDEKSSSASISYWVDEKYTNRGIATNAVILIKNYAITELKLQMLEAYVQQHNEASIKVLNKADFRKAEALTKALRVEDSQVFHDIYIYQE